MNNRTPLTALCVLIATAPFIQAATKTWDGGATTMNWADAANWSLDGVPTSSDAVRLDNTAVNPVPQTRTDVTLTVQAADSLNGPWEAAAVSLQGAAFTTPVSSNYTVLETLTGGATDHMEVRDRYTIGIPAHPSRFMRLRVTRP